MTVLELTGAQRRDKALALALANASDEWKRLALGKIAYLAGTGFAFQAYTLVVHGVPEPDHPARWGAVFNHAAKVGLPAVARGGMRPVTVVVGLDYDDARRYVLANRDTLPAVAEARLLSSTSHPDRARGLVVGRVFETPAARLGQHYADVMVLLRSSTAMRRRAPLT